MCHKISIGNTVLWSDDCTKCQKYNSSTHTYTLSPILPGIVVAFKELGFHTDKCHILMRTWWQFFQQSPAYLQNLLIKIRSVKIYIKCQKLYCYIKMLYLQETTTFTPSQRFLSTLATEKPRVILNYVPIRCFISTVVLYCQWFSAVGVCMSYGATCR